MVCRVGSIATVLLLACELLQAAVEKPVGLAQPPGGLAEPATDNKNVLDDDDFADWDSEFGMDDDDDDWYNSIPKPSTGAPKVPSPSGKMNFDELDIDSSSAGTPDFKPQFLATIPIGPKGTQTIENDLQTKGPVKGMYFVSSSESESNSDIDVLVTDPDGKVLFSKSGSREAKFTFTVERLGVHKLIINNGKWLKSKLVTLLLGGTKKSSNVKRSEVLSLVDKARAVDTNFRDVLFEHSYLMVRQKSAVKYVTERWDQMMYIVLIACFVILVTATGNTMYIKRLLGNRRML